ncbi:glycosyltransferase family 39 protein [Sphingomonas abietis]|uniref:Glycosyltransferase RgtA/B/C/D-like domain-containing protein n=1 Tax=Sphingomonas abietis TaxID=3012344 RepID=A0ABY7NMH5_9SPHN|nr:hypothetical protein [Sphingomonas abietis]WBO22699.1 hypothetical protein PBT88_00655 [Sphingomonas abietis]
MQARRAALPVVMAVAAVLAGSVLRLWHVAGEPLWLDEAYSAFAADHGFAFLWHVVPQYETHPPVYYSLLRIWSGWAGTGLVARRALGLLCGFGTILVVGMVAARLGRITRMSRRDRLWLIAIMLSLVALQPLLIAMSRQVRPYPVMILVYATSLLPLLRLIQDTARRNRPDRAAIAGFFLCEALMLWLHSLGPLFGLSMTLALGVAVLKPGLGRRDWTWLAGGQAVVGLIYLPAFLIMIHQATGWVSSTWVTFAMADVPVAIGQIYLDWNLWARLIALVAAIVGATLLLRRLGGGRLLTILLLMALLPVLLSILLSALVSPVFLARTLSPAAIPALLLLSVGLVWPGRWLWAGLVPLSAVLGSMVIIDRMEARVGPAQDWYGAIAWLTPRMAPGDVVWAYPNEGALPLAYALRDQRRHLPLMQVPAAMPALAVPGYHPTGSRGAVSLYPAQIDALMRTDAARRPPTIWLLRLTGPLYDTNDHMLHALERNRVTVGRFQSRQIDLIGLRRTDLAPVAAAEQAQP